MSSFRMPARPQPVPAEEALEAVSPTAVHRQYRALFQAQAKAIGLEQLVMTLEAHQGPFTPFQLRMLEVSGTQYGVTLPHRQVGLSLEAYQGPRGRQLVHIGLEGFKEGLKKLVAWILKQLKQLKDSLKKFFRHIQTSTEAISRRLKNTPTKTVPSEAAVIAAYRALSVDGGFKPDVISTTLMEWSRKAVFQYIDESTHFHEATMGVMTAVSEAAKKQLNDHADDGDMGLWEEAVAKASQLKLPVFAQFERNGTTFTSPPLVSGRAMALTYGKDAFQDHDGLAHLRALATMPSIRYVADEKALPDHAVQVSALRQYQERSLKAEIATVHALSRRMEAISPLFDQLISLHEKGAERGEASFANTLAHRHESVGADLIHLVLRSWLAMATTAEHLSCMLAMNVKQYMKALADIRDMDLTPAAE